MVKNMQKIVLFIEPNEDIWSTPLKIGTLFMNRFAVDEDAATEILKIFELEKSSYKVALAGEFRRPCPDFDEECKRRRKQKGMDLIMKIKCFLSSRIKIEREYVYSVMKNLQYYIQSKV